MVRVPLNTLLGGGKLLLEEEKKKAYLLDNIRFYSLGALGFKRGPVYVKNTGLKQIK